MMNNQKSIKSQLSRYTRQIVLIVILMSVFLVVTNLQTHKRMSSVTGRYQDMLQVYQDLTSAQNSMKRYMIEHDPNEFLVYQEYVESARLKVRSFSSFGVNEWRYELLLNMIDSYDEVAKEATRVAQNSQEETIAFDKTMQAFEILSGSTNDYFSYLVEDSKVENENALNALRKSFLLGLGTITSALIFMYGLSRILTKQLLRPLEQIIQNINRMEKQDYDLARIKTDSIEMAELDHSIQEMAIEIQKASNLQHEISDLERKFLEERNENLVLKELSTQAALKMMQSQLNPHFLFNTLNTIYKLTLDNDAQEASYLIEKLSQFLRYTLDYSDEMSNIIHELASLQDYLDIQEIRFRDRIAFDLSIEPNIPALPFPGMIIQPIIENSITHGFRNMVEECEISVEVGVNGNVLGIVISDNGEGMSEDSIDNIYMNNYSYFNNDFDLGLYTSIKRLRLVYGDKVRVSINTCEGCGFEVIIEVEI